MLAADLHEGMYCKHHVCLLHLFLPCSVVHVCVMSQQIDNWQSNLAVAKNGPIISKRKAENLLCANSLSTAFVL